ncbi:MAG: recombinase family protein [Dissulfurispiraceae bacterium]
MKKEVRVALYARCSTHDRGQDPELQLVPLREYCQRRSFEIAGEYVRAGREKLDMALSDKAALK